MFEVLGVNRSKRKKKELERERERERAHKKTSGAKSSKIPKLTDLENPRKPTTNISERNLVSSEPISFNKNKIILTLFYLEFCQALTEPLAN